MSERKCSPHITSKFADGSGIENELSFDLHSYVNSEFYAQEKPNVLYLFDEAFDEDLITNTKYPWVQFAKDTQSKLIGLELRGRGKSIIEGHDPKTSEFFTIKRHLEDLYSIEEYNCYEFGPASWLIVGRGYSAELAIWSRLDANSQFVCTLAFDVDTKNLTEYNGNSFVDYNPSNIILVGSSDSKINEYKQFTKALNNPNSKIAILAEKDNNKIVEQLKKFVTSENKE